MIKNVAHLIVTNVAIFINSVEFGMYSVQSVSKEFLGIMLIIAHKFWRENAHFTTETRWIVDSMDAPTAALPHFLGHTSKSFRYFLITWLSNVPEKKMFN